MVCEHLRELERELLLGGIKVTFRGQAWSDNCREWVYFDAFLDTSRIRERYQLSSVVRDHTHRGTHDGEEHGLVCSACHDALVGFLEPKVGKAIFPMSP